MGLDLREKGHIPELDSSRVLTFEFQSQQLEGRELRGDQHDGHNSERKTLVYN